MNNFLMKLSTEIDTVIDKSKLGKSYAVKKACLLSIVGKMFGMLKMDLNETTFKKFMLAKYSLALSIKQLDHKLMEECEVCKQGKCGINNDRDEEACLRALNGSNVIDNIVFSIPLSIMSSEEFPLMIKSLTYENIKGSSDHRSRLLIAMYEKFTKKKFPAQMEKPFAKVMTMYDATKKMLASYI